MRSSRSLALIAALVGLPVLAAFAPDGRLRDFERSARAGLREFTGIAAAVEPAPEFYFAGMNPGAVQDICDAVQAGDKVGEWWCLRPDGGTLSGSQIAFTAINTPGQAAQRVCSNDTDCLNVNMRGPLNGSTSAGSMDYTSATTAPTGDFSVVYTSLSKPVVPAGSYGFPMTKRQSGLGQYNSGQDRAASAISETICVSSTCNGPSISLEPGVEYQRAQTLVQSTGEHHVYLDSAEVYTSIHGARTLGDSTRHGVGGRPDDTGVWGFATFDTHRGALFTEKVLSPTDIARFSAAQFIESTDLATDSGVRLTWTRGSVRSCLTEDTTRGSHIYSDRPCVSGDGVNLAPATTNLLLRSDALALGSAAVTPWADVGTPILTGNAVADLTGFALLATIEDDAAGASEGLTQNVTTSTASKFTLSCWVASGTLTTARLSIVGTGNGAGDVTCSLSGLTATASRKTCTSSAAYTGALTAIDVSILPGANDAATGSISAGSCQLRASDAAGPYIRTDGTTRASLADALSGSVTFPRGVASASGVWRSPDGIDTAVSTARPLVEAKVDSTNRFRVTMQSDRTLKCRWTVGGVDSFITSTATFTAGAVDTWRCAADGGMLEACVSGVCSLDAGSPVPPAGAQTVYVGHLGGTAVVADGIIKALCLDGDVGRCR